MMRKALVASIGMAAMLALAACSGNDVDRAEHDAVLAGNDGLRSDIARQRSDLTDTQAALAAARERLQEAEDLYLLAKQNARTAQQGYEKAERDFDNGLLSRTMLENARAEAERAQAVAEAARTTAEAARKTADDSRKRLQTLADLMVSTRDLPKSYNSGVVAQTEPVTVKPGQSMTIGNVRFNCNADAPEPGCVVTVTSDGRFRSNTVFVTASLVPAPTTDRLLSGTVGTVGEGDVAVIHSSSARAAAGEDPNNVAVYIREATGGTTDYKVTATLRDPFVIAGVAAADRGANQWRLYAGTPNARPGGHDGVTAADFKVETAPGTSTGWSITSLDGFSGVETNTTFGADEPWTKSWTVDGADLGDSRRISIDVYTDAEPTKTTTNVNEAFSDARDRAAVTAALTNAGFPLLYDIGGYPAAYDPSTDNVLPVRFAYQLEIDAETDSTISANVDEGKRIRLSDRSELPDDDPDSSANNQYHLSQLTPAGTPAWFYGIPGNVVCGGSPASCGNARIQYWGAGSGTYFVVGTPRASLTFQADDGDHEFYVPDTDWVSIGVWSVEPASDGTAANVQMGAFVHGSMPWNYGNSALAFTEDTTVRYAGDAVGRYAQRDGNDQVESGKFAATVNLAFAFDGGSARDDDRLSGSITGFRLAGKDEDENWRLRLPTTSSYKLLHDEPAGSAPCGTTNLVGGTGACGNLAGLDGLADGFTMVGRMNARAFGPDATADDPDLTPGAIAGTFFAEQNTSAGRTNDLSLIGAFLADRQPAATQ